MKRKSKYTHPELMLEAKERCRDCYSLTLKGYPTHYIWHCGQADMDITAIVHCLEWEGDEGVIPRTRLAPA